MYNIIGNTTAKTYTKGLKLIGKGLFTKCYGSDDSNEVILLSVDQIKECMAFGWFPECSLFPIIEKLDYLSDGDFVYKMKRYAKVKSLKNNLDADQYEIYKTLKLLANKFSDRPHNDYDLYHYWYKTFSTIKDEELQQCMLEALDGCSNCGSDINFEYKSS